MGRRDDMRMPESLIPPSLMVVVLGMLASLGWGTADFGGGVTSRRAPVLGVLGGIWLVAVWRERRGENKTRQDLVCCRICGHVYENAEKRPVSACPQCGSLNEPTKPKPI